MENFILMLFMVIVSLTEIRGRVKAGKTLTGYLDEEVIRYIGEHKLYADE